MLSGTATLVTSLLMASLNDVIATQTSDGEGSGAAAAFDTNSGMLPFSHLALSRVRSIVWQYKNV